MGNIEGTKERPRDVRGSKIGKENRNERGKEKGEAAKRPLERADTCVLLGTLGYTCVRGKADVYMCGWLRVCGMS